MIKIGEYNELLAFRQTDHGIYLLDKEDREEVLLPNVYVGELKIGDSIEVFVYKDSEGREVATTLKPLLKLNEIGKLTVKQKTRVGHFLDLGLSKDVLLPFKEQIGEIEVGQEVLVCITLDYSSERLVASMRIDRFLDNETLVVKEEQEAECVVYRKSDMGYLAMIEKQNIGLIYERDLHRELSPGEVVKCLVKKIRPDKKIDLFLIQDYKEIQDKNAEAVLSYLESKDGIANISDKSDPELIKRELNMSKKTFKKAIGSLYRQNKIKIFKDKIVQNK